MGKPPSGMGANSRPSNQPTQNIGSTNPLRRAAPSSATAGATAGATAPPAKRRALAGPDGAPAAAVAGPADLPDPADSQDLRMGGGSQITGISLCESLGGAGDKVNAIKNEEMKRLAKVGGVPGLGTWECDAWCDLVCSM